MSGFNFFDLWFCTSWLIGTACVLQVIFKYARKFVHVTVNCWFCNSNSKIPLINKNEWHCMHCDQFNGFDKDGNYSKLIPEQFSENLNIKSYRSYFSSHGNIRKSNGLCRICNANQELKVRQLAVYEPFREENYDQEIELFRQRLEKSYKLCSVCEKTVQNTLKLKSNLYAKVYDQIFFENEKETTEFSNKKKAWFSICASVLAIFTLMASFWEYFPNKINFLQNDIHTDFLPIDLLSVFRDYEIFINILLATCMTIFIKLKRPNSRIFSRFLILGCVFFGVQAYLPLILKILAIIIFSIYFIIARWQRNKPSVKCRKLSDSFKNRLIELDEDRKSVSDDNLRSSSDVLVANPLCGRFSSMTLGSSSTAASSKSVPYLFKSTRSILQPPRLKLDESERCETPRSSRSTSSGYESVSNYFKRSPDSISEFDSVSQIGKHSPNSSFELRNRFFQKTDNVDEVSPNKRLCNFGGHPNLISPYMQPNQHFSPSEHYYGASPTFSPKQSPHVPLNAVVSTLQIIFFSVTFFILGFCFQLFVNKLLS